MKKKLLNALRVRMGWLGYQFGPVTNPFEQRFCIAVKNPDGKSRIVFIDESRNDYNDLASVLHNYPLTTQINPLDTQEATNDD